MEARGTRRRLCREQADSLAAAYDSTGLTRAEFCQRHGVSISTLSRYVAHWRQRPNAADHTRQWVAVELAESPAAAAGGLVIALPGNRRIEVNRGFDTDTLIELLRVLEPR